MGSMDAEWFRAISDDDAAGDAQFEAYQIHRQLDQKRQERRGMGEF